MYGNSTSAHTSGHVFTVARRSGVQWYAKWRIPIGTDGKRTTYVQRQCRLGPAWTERSLAPAGFFTKKTAEAELRRILTAAEQEPQSVAEPSSLPPFAVAAKRWLAFIEHDRKRKRSTLIGCRQCVDADLVPVFGERRLDEITSGDVDRFRVSLLSRDLSARSVNRIVSQLRSMFAWFADENVYGLALNPAARVRRQPESRSSDFSVLSVAEVGALARAAESDQDAALFTVAAFTGLRLGELRALRWRDVDFASRIVHVRQNFVAGEMTSPKGKRVRSVPLIDQAAVALDGLSRRERFVADDDLVFPNPAGAPFDASGLRRRFAVALSAAGLRHIRFHDLRHSFGTLAVQEFALSDVQAYMGHADVATTMIYVHHVPKLDAAQRLSALVETEMSLGAVTLGERSLVHA
jgi:integrase